MTDYHTITRSMWGRGLELALDILPTLNYAFSGRSIVLDNLKLHKNIYIKPSFLNFSSTFFSLKSSFGLGVMKVNPLFFYVYV